MLKLGCVCVLCVMGRKEEEVTMWKEQMGYDAVQKNMMGDSALERLCCPVVVVAERYG